MFYTVYFNVIEFHCFLNGNFVVVVVVVDCVVDCVKFVEYHCLEFVLCALSSHVADIRTCAYHILAQFKDHLQAQFPIVHSQKLRSVTLL